MAELDRMRYIFYTSELDNLRTRYKPGGKSQRVLYDALERANNNYLFFINASTSIEKLEEYARPFVQSNDIEGLKDLFMRVFEELQSEYSLQLQKMQSTKTKTERGWHIDPSRIMYFEPELFYITTRGPVTCAFCERLLNEEGKSGYYFLKKGIFEEIADLKEDQYYLNEVKCDWCDRYCFEDTHRSYSSAFTPEGLNYFYAKGLLSIPRFPAMRLTLYDRNRHKRQEIIRALGKMYRVKDERTGKTRLKFMYTIRELVLSFLEGSERKMRHVRRQNLHADPSDFRGNDPTLLGKNY